MYKKYNMARIKGAMLRRMEDCKYKLYWTLHPEFARRNAERIATYRNFYEGKRCFVLGNGPSLKKQI